MVVGNFARRMCAPCWAGAGAGQALALVQRLAAGDAKGLLEVIEATVEYAPDYEAVLGEILDILHRVAVCQVLNRPVAEASGADTDIAALADTLAPEDGQLFYQIALIGRRDLGLAPDPEARVRDGDAAHAGLPARNCAGRIHRARPHAKSI